MKIRLSFAYTVTRAQIYRVTRQFDFRIGCKKCGENIPMSFGTTPGCLTDSTKLSFIGDLPGQPLGRKVSAISAALMGEMKRAIARERVAWAEQMQEQTRMKSTLVIAAAIIAAVRLARDPDISRPSPRLTAVVSDSVNLARMILDRVGR